MSNYTIHLTREKSRCIASIPELCITGEAADPKQALISALQKETELLKDLIASGLPLPPSITRAPALPIIRRILIKLGWFFGKVAVALVFVLALSAVTTAVIYPELHKRVKNYAVSPASTDLIQKALNHFGISVCIDGKDRINHP